MQAASYVQRDKNQPPRPVGRASPVTPSLRYGRILSDLLDLQSPSGTIGV